MLVAIIIAAVIALIATAAVLDVVRLTIPNWPAATVAGLFPVAAIADGFPFYVIALNLAFGAATLLGCFFLFNGRVLSGGDAKLIPGVAVWTGALGFVPFALAAAVAAGVMIVALLGVRHLMKPHAGLPAFLNRLLDRKSSAPYGAAIALAAAFAITQTPFADNFPSLLS